MARCTSFHVSDGIAYQCALDRHTDDDCEHAALDTADGGGGRWALVVWTSDLAYPAGTP